ncbi:MAG TPA: hypothetical protein VMG58_03015, partial [Candidatus Sulfotelmatobacter sp.]|nr:hypothetical protein [Candidatus Sulfotelmatobacter sp.]
LTFQPNLIKPRAVLASVAERQGDLARVRALILDIQAHLRPDDPRVESVRDSLMKLNDERAQTQEAK